MNSKIIYALVLLLALSFINSTAFIKGTAGTICFSGLASIRQCWLYSIPNSSCCYCPNCGGSSSCIFTGNNSRSGENVAINYNNQRVNLMCSSKFLAFSSIIAIFLAYLA